MLFLFKKKKKKIYISIYDNYTTYFRKKNNNKLINRRINCGNPLGSKSAPSIPSVSVGLFQGFVNPRNHYSGTTLGFSVKTLC